MSLQAAQVTTPTMGSANTLAPLPRFRSGTSLPSAGRAVSIVTRIAGQAFLRMPPSTWLVVDVLLISAGVWIAFAAYPQFANAVDTHVAFWQAGAVFSFSVILSSLVFGLYERETLTGRSRILTRMLLTAITATLIAYTIIYVVMYSQVSRRVTTLAILTFLCSGTLVRMLALWTITEVHRGLLVVGTKPLYESFVTAQERGLLHEYRLVGYATVSGSGAAERDDDACLGAIVDEVNELVDQGVTDIVVSAQAADDANVMDWVVPSLQAGCRVTNEAIFYETATGQILVDEITPYWFLFSDLRIHCDEHATLKRAVDIVASAVGLLITLPVWPLIALGVKLGDGGPVFYSQERTGQNGSTFRLFKFRTMTTDAEKDGKSVWATPGDPRVTRFGRFLRRSRLDELPQLWNVLAGQMSLVGPRPERPDIVADLCEKLPYYAERHLVKPGVTGWAQISYKYGSSVEDAKRKLQFDLYYLKHMSFELDAVILFRTLGTFLRGGC